jgi:hypothetical protein
MVVGNEPKVSEVFERAVLHLREKGDRFAGLELHLPSCRLCCKEIDANRRIEAL